MFEITTLKTLSEKQKNSTTYLHKPHKLNNYCIIVITNGFGYHFIDFKQYDFAKGTFLFIAKGQVHSFDFKPGNDGFIITFSEDFLTNSFKHSWKLSETWLFNYHIGIPKIQLKSIEQEDFFDLTEKLNKEYHTKNLFARDVIIQSLLNLLVLRSERIKRAEFLKYDKTNYNDLFFKFKRLTEETFSETRNANYFAEKLSISYKHLNKICKLSVNKTAKQFIDDFIFMESRRCLLSSGMSVREISEHTGFDEPTNFVKYFKKHSGQTPEKFRKKNKPTQ